jgi:hypothetical protein
VHFFFTQLIFDDLKVRYALFYYKKSTFSKAISLPVNGHFVSFVQFLGSFGFILLLAGAILITAKTLPFSGSHPPRFLDILKIFKTGAPGQLLRDFLHLLATPLPCEPGDTPVSLICDKRVLCTCSVGFPVSL